MFQYTLTEKSVADSLWVSKFSGKGFEIMARDEADREDLVKEATAYAVRGECSVSDWEHPIFVGFRDNGNFSFYFGAEPVYQFDAAGRLRRAFVAGLLYRSEGEFLSSMKRERSETETSLMRTDLSPEQSEFFRWGMHEAIRQFEAAIERSRYQICEVIGGEKVWIEKIEQGCKKVLGSNEFLSPRLVSR